MCDPKKGDPVHWLIDAEEQKSFSVFLGAVKPQGTFTENPDLAEICSQ